MAGEDFDVDCFLNLDAMDEEISVEALLEAADANAQLQLDPATLGQPLTVPASPPVHHQQALPESSSAYGFDEQIMMQAPITHVNHPDVQQHLQHPQAPVQHHQMLVGSGFHDQMHMPAPIPHFQTNIQAAPLDQVPETGVLLQNFLDESTLALDIHGFDEEMLMTASEDEEEFPDLPSPDSFPMYDIDEAFISDEVNQADANVIPYHGPMEDEERFVPLAPGRLQCGDCRVVRQIRVQTDTEEGLIRLHGTTNGRFEHAILDRTYIGNDSEAPRAERLYVDFSRRTGEWVLNFIANIIWSLKNETVGVVEDSDEPVNTPPIVNDAYQLMEIAMLKIIDSTPEYAQMAGALSLPRAAQPAPMPPPPPLTTQPAPAMEAASDANVSHKIIKPDIFESRPFVRIEQSSDSARVHSTRQQERREEQETRQYLHDLKEKAQMDLDVQKQALAVKRFCRKKQWTYRLNLIKRINKKIIKMEKRALTYPLSRLLKIRDTFDKLVVEKENLVAHITTAMNNESGNKGSYSVGKNDDEAGPSSTKKL
ncbi:uncharacterized protein [Lolium perenne]|uniref:uncharacterized protein isoform X2 n=1 Tax=Lolium perenne TaxID=4522 RepID=UPI0021F63724|nr:uncharacterized protein LOC127321387 isoform X2 [Lolium perenne]